MKRIVCLCILAALCLCVLLPGKTWAEEANGTCGENLIWELKDGILTISGTGEMTQAPWLDQKHQITEVVIEEGVTNICEGAFDDCIYLKYVSIPASVTKLGNRAFAACNRLKFLLFHGDKPEMTPGCFAHNASSATAYYPVGNKTWSRGYITTGTYIYCMGTDYATSGAWDDNIVWKFENGVLTFSGTGVMKGYSAQDIMPWEIYQHKTTKVVFESGITTIANYTLIRFFRVEEIIISDTVTNILWGAFSGCTSLRTIKLPEHLEKIGEETFANCSSLETISIPASVRCVDGNAFRNCTSLKTIYFYGDKPKNEGIMFGDSLFEGTTATAYYPVGRQSWEGLDFGIFGGDMTWKTFCANQHTEEIVEAVAPSCTATGLTAGKVCKHCGKVLQAQEKVPATDHVFGEWVEVKAATTEENGLAVRKCENCDETQQKELEKLAPVPTDTPTEPTQEPTQATQESTKPTTAPTEPTQPDITVTEEPKTFPWAMVIIGVVVVAGCGAAGFLISRKRG